MLRRAEFPSRLEGKLGTEPQACPFRERAGDIAKVRKLARSIHAKAEQVGQTTCDLHHFHMVQRARRRLMVAADNVDN